MAATAVGEHQPAKAQPPAAKKQNNARKRPTSDALASDAVEVSVAEQAAGPSDADEQHAAEPSGAGEGDEHGGAQPRNKRKRVNKELSEKKLQRLKEQQARRGIVYISRIPPHMKPQKLKHMLSQYGEIGRVYLAPEDPLLRKKRKREGKDTGKNFTEGWIEFEDKAVAKQVAAMLNGQQMGGKRRSAYHYDLWNLKYLPKFKWDHLAEEIAYERAVREQKLAVELGAAKRERDFYLQQVARAKADEAMAARRKKRQAQAQEQAGGAEAAGGGSADAGSRARGGADGSEGDALPAKKIKRVFGQRRTKADPTTAEAPALPDDVLALIGGGA